MPTSGVGADNVANDADAIVVTWNNYLFLSFLYSPSDVFLAIPGLHVSPPKHKFFDALCRKDTS